ncbi:MAG: hypothetical protein EP349_00945 [Alphaproteobacteria bacterium]|nr:MAG: hypothetical protein EP349_00945 [Alphaproteobacteria bacterium]
MIPTWAERQRLLGFCADDVQKLAIAQSTYNSPYAQMVKKLFTDLYGVRLVEIAFEVAPEEIGLIDSSGQPVLTAEQQDCFERNRAKLEAATPNKPLTPQVILAEALENGSFTLTPTQTALLEKETKKLHDNAATQLAQADMVFLAGNASDVPPDFYDKSPHPKTKIRKNPLYIRPDIDRNIVAYAGKKDLPMLGVCYGAQMMAITGFGDDSKKGAWLIQDIPDHGHTKNKDTKTHIKPMYGGVTRKVTAAFVDNGEYITAITGKSKNPFIHSDAVQPIKVTSGTNLHALIRTAFPNMHYTADQTIEIVEYHSHHQALKWDSIDPDKGLHIAAWSEERFVEAVEAGRDANGNKLATFMLGTQVHPEVGVAMPPAWLEDARKGHKISATGGLTQSFAEAMIYTSIFLNKWQKAGFNRQDAPTYSELVAFEEQFMELPPIQQEALGTDNPAIIHYVAQQLNLTPKLRTSSGKPKPQTP